jgi:hypothetical protein
VPKRREEVSDLDVKLGLNFKRDVYCKNGWEQYTPYTESWINEHVTPLREDSEDFFSTKDCEFLQRAQLQNVMARLVGFR